jgi:putative transposase
MGSARRRDLFLTILEEVRLKYKVQIAGYVVMPEHFHLLMSEPERGTPATIMQVLKQRVSIKCRARGVQTFPTFWLPRSHDFNVASRRKFLEKLEYMHFNPVKRGLVTSPELWKWSSYCAYENGTMGEVKITFL